MTQLTMLLSEARLTKDSISVTFVFDPAIAQWLESVRNFVPLIISAYIGGRCLVFKGYVQDVSMEIEAQHFDIVSLTLLIKISGFGK